MITRICLICCLLPVAESVARGEDNLPKPLTFARYQSMTEHSPFAVATAAAPPPVAPNFAKDLYVANAAHSPDGDMVTIASSADKNFKKYLTTSTPVDGFSISNMEWSEKVGATKVTIAKDGQFATLTFNQALLSQPIASTQPGPPPSNNSQPPPALNPAPVPMPVPNAGMPPNVNTTKPMPVPSIPMLPTPPSRVRGVIPRSPAGASPNGNL